MSWYLSACLTEDTQQKLLEWRKESGKSVDSLRTFLRLNDLGYTYTIHDPDAAEWRQSLIIQQTLTE